ncbi:MAG: hypothetical protein A2298_00675, partial [Gammaproteobacteria bacterium RIFOXYB2_FULL_38_6]
MSTKIQHIQSADVVNDSMGRQYHVHLAPGELAEFIILVGEAARAERAAELLSDIRIHEQNREYNSFTGKYKGLEVTIMSTGMGPGATEIGLVEIFQLTKCPTIIRVGTCGALQANINLGDLVISSGAVRLEDTSTCFVVEGYPAIAHHEVVLALIKAAHDEKAPHHVGITATASGFYGAQGRKIPGLYVRNPNLPDELAQMNVYNFEMEASTIFTLMATQGFRSGAVCATVANRPCGTFIDPESKKIAEKNSLM